MKNWKSIITWASNSRDAGKVIQAITRDIKSAAPTPKASASLALNFAINSVARVIITRAISFNNSALGSPRVLDPSPDVLPRPPGPWGIVPALRAGIVDPE